MIGVGIILLRQERGYTRTVNCPPSGVAPALAHLLRDPVPTLLNTTFYDDGGWYRKHDSVEADGMWIEYSQSEAGFLMIPREDAEMADIDPDRHAYIDRPDLGMVGYIAIPEAMHQMHCVNTLRKNLWYNIEHTRKNCKECLKEPYATFHVDHCLDIIRKRIECTADLGLVPFLWVGTKGAYTGDVARMHTCANYEGVRKYVAENSIPPPPPGVLKKPEGASYAEAYM